MHQHPRPPPQMAYPASAPSTNPQRTNNPREESLLPHSRKNSEVLAYNDTDQESISSGSGTVATTTGPSRDAIKKLDQILQNFFLKTAIVVLQSRMPLPIILTRDDQRKVNKWFQLETDDTEAFRDELRIWKTCGAFENRPPPLIIETYLDTSELTSRQSLVIVDESGKRWDVAEAMNTMSGFQGESMHQRRRPTEVILERWKIDMRQGDIETATDFGSTLPTVYKKCIVFFRSLYMTSKIVPAWKFARTLSKSGSANTPLRVKCRIIRGTDFRASTIDALTQPLFESLCTPTTDFFIGETDTPAGPISAQICYRNDCTFRVDDSESFLSSRFLGADELYLDPRSRDEGEGRRHGSRNMEVGSLPVHRQISQPDKQDPVQAYGSLSTFHGSGRPGSASPISALRAAGNMGSGAGSSPSGSYPRALPAQAGRSSTRPLEGIAMARRPSNAFNPFKAGSLSSSPNPGYGSGNQGEMLPPQSPQSLPRGSGISVLAQARNRSSLTIGQAASLRGVPLPPDGAIASSGSSSPRPTPVKYSSSFSHRRSKPSFGASSKHEDDQGSSGKQSLSSSAQPGSGILAEVTGTSADSLHTNDESIKDFLDLLDDNQNLISFQAPRSDETAKRTSAQLSRYQSMRESNNTFSESMSSSMMQLHRSSSASSRQLSSVPPMIAATSMSTSSSPGKPISPHTPHTPMIPSRLSANSIVDYSQPQRSRSRTTPHRIEDVSGDESSGTGTTAIDIPTSPHPYYPHNRRSSSVAQQQRHTTLDDDIGDLPFGGNRSISLGADREAPSISDLRGQLAGNRAGGSSAERVLQPSAQIDESGASLTRHSSSPFSRESLSVPRAPSSGSSAPYRPRLGRGGGRGLTPPTGSDAGSERGSTSGLSDRPRSGFNRPSGTYDVDDEPLLFDMSEIGRGDQSRRSLEEARGGSSLVGERSTGLDGSKGSGERGGFDGSRGGDSRSSSRRGSSRKIW